MTYRDKLNRLKDLIYIRPILTTSSQPLDIDITDANFSECYDQLVHKVGGELFLNRFSPRDLMAIFEEVGIPGKLKSMSISDLNISVDRNDLYLHKMRLYTGEEVRENLLMELVVKEGVFKPKKLPVPGFSFEDLRILMIEWMSLQNPKRRFTEERPRLPGQRYPGLGILRNMEAVLVRFAREQGHEGIMDIPEHFHGALMYSTKLSFFNPLMQGKFEAMVRDLKDTPMERVSYAVSLGCVLNTSSGQYETWEPGEQILPVSRRLMEYFSSEGYRELALRARWQNTFTIDLPKLEKELKKAEYL